MEFRNWSHSCTWVNIVNNLVSQILFNFLTGGERLLQLIKVIKRETGKYESPLMNMSIISNVCTVQNVGAWSKQSEDTAVRQSWSGMKWPSSVLIEQWTHKHGAMKNVQTQRTKGA